MQDRLSALDDPTAIALLTALALPKLRHEGLQADLTADLREAFAMTYGTAEAPTSEGDLAREALLFLARDPAMHPVLTALLDGPQLESFGKTPANKTAAPGSKKLPITVAVLLTLQTHVHIERDANGQWTFLFDKPTATAEQLKPLVQKLVSLPAGK